MNERWIRRICIAEPLGEIRAGDVRNAQVGQDGTSRVVEKNVGWLEVDVLRCAFRKLLMPEPPLGAVIPHL